MAHRIDLNSIPAADRQKLSNLILQYLNDAIVDQHMAINHSGIDFLTGHRPYIGALEAWLAANGGPEFVPLPEWNPVNSIPPELNVVKARDNGTARLPLVNLDPNVPPPMNFGFPSVCSVLSLLQLAGVMEPWHDDVHVAVGGTMGDLMNAPAAPIFWCWHAYLDDIYADWEACQRSGQPGHERPDKGTEGYELRKKEYGEARHYWEQPHDEKFPHTTPRHETGPPKGTYSKR